MWMRSTMAVVFCGALWAAVVAQSPGTPEKVRSEKVSEVSKADKLAPIVVVSAHAKETRERALGALSKQVACVFSEKPVSEVVSQLSKESGIPIEFDQRALEEATIGTDTPITISREKCSLHDALDAVTRDHNLAWHIRGVGIMVTTKEAIDSNPDYRDTILYPVSDLLVNSGHSFREEAYADLIDSIVKTVRPDSWRDTGTGEGAIVPAMYCGCIMVTQNNDVHEQVESILQAIRIAHAKRTDDSRPLRDPKVVKQKSAPGGGGFSGGFGGGGAAGGSN